MIERPRKQLVHMRHPETNRTAGLDQGYAPLHIHDIKIGDVPAMETDWMFLDPADGKLKTIRITILGEVPPPMMVERLLD